MDIVGLELTRTLGGTVSLEAICRGSMPCECVCAPLNDISQLVEHHRAPKAPHKPYHARTHARTGYAHASESFTGRIHAIAFLGAAIDAVLSGDG